MKVITINGQIERKIYGNRQRSVILEDLSNFELVKLTVTEQV
jgi:hypothetical protein